MFTFDKNLLSVLSNNQYELHQWESVLENNIRKEKKLPKLYSIESLINLFNEQIILMAKHMFNINNQFKKSYLLKNNLTKNQIIIHIDFSENYQLKVYSEPQAASFGSSKSQVSLRTGMMYVKSNDETPFKIPFATLSPCLNHNSTTIWTLLLKPLEFVKSNYPAVKMIHFFI